PEEKARIVAESSEASETVCAVARRHGLTPQQLFTWRREARKRMEAEAPPAFVPAVLVAPGPQAEKGQKPRAKRRGRRRRAGAIEIEASGVTVRVGDGASSATIAAVSRPIIDVLEPWLRGKLALVSQKSKLAEAI